MKTTTSSLSMTLIMTAIGFLLVSLFSMHAFAQQESDLPKLDADACKEFSRGHIRGDCFDHVREQGHLALDIYDIFQLRDTNRLRKTHCQEFTTDQNMEMYRFCRHQYFLQGQELREKIQVSSAYSRWELTADYCQSLKYSPNISLCQKKLAQLDAHCHLQKTAGKKIYVDLSSQMLFAVKDCRLVVASRIMSGKNSTPTIKGNFRFYKERTNHYMDGEWFVTKAMYFQGLYAVHDADVWRDTAESWKKELRPWRGSHGCVNLPKEAMDIVFDEYDIGDAISIVSYLDPEISEELWQKVDKRKIIDPSTGA